jgi:D-arabinitol dehydrogenase (NADP+)
MKAVVYSEPKVFTVTQVDKPTISPNQVLIRVRACGVCRTDIHLHDGEFLSRYPLTPGHEFAGDIVEVGSEVKGFHIGDRVTADNTVLCGECFYCRRNQPLYCHNFYSLGCNGPGGFAEYVKVNYDKVFHLRDTTTYETASFTEPTACAIHGMDMIDVKCGDDVLIFGAGPTGIILTQLIKQGGAANVVVCASNQKKLDLIERNGYADIVKMDRNDYSKHTKELKARYPDDFDIVIDATGSPKVLEQCFTFGRMGAKIVVYGVANEADRIRISPYEMFAKEFKLIGSYAQTHCFDRALQYLESGRIKVDDLITDRFDLDGFPDMLDKMFHGKDNIKIIITP